jgi:prevent-host-death family protein
MIDKTLVNVHEAKTHLSRLLERVSRGEEIIICKAGEPVAKLVPLPKLKEPRKPGILKGQIWMADDWDSEEVNREIEELFYGSEIEPPS